MENLTEVYKQHRQMQDKYTYFLLAVAASAIALSLKRTADAKMTFSMIPLALAILCWGFSFFCGCRYLGYIGSNLYANFNLLTIQKGGHPEIGSHPQMIEAATQGIKEAFEYNSNKAESSGRWQFRWLISGALLFISWHIFEMVKVTIRVAD